jgi:hypothetical protein
LYHQQIKNGEMKQGYACNERSGILFKNGKFIESVSLNDVNHSYFVTLKNKILDVQKLDSKILVNEKALEETSYTTMEMDKILKDFSETNNQDTPLNAFVAVNYNDRLKEITNENKRDKILSIKINKIFIYNDSIAGVVNKAYDDFYGLWYFYYEDGKWINAGEDIGGDTVFESEITFRERAKLIMEKAKK